MTLVKAGKSKVNGQLQSTVGKCRSKVGQHRSPIDQRLVNDWKKSNSISESLLIPSFTHHFSFLKILNISLRSKKNQKKKMKKILDFLCFLLCLLRVSSLFTSTLIFLLIGIVFLKKIQYPLIQTQKLQKVENPKTPLLLTSLVWFFLLPLFLP